MKGINKLVLVCVFVVFWLGLFVGLTPNNCMTEEVKAENQCVVCHTDVKKLIRLSWEIEKIRPKPVKSAETSGEG